MKKKEWIHSSLPLSHGTGTYYPWPLECHKSVSSLWSRSLTSRDKFLSEANYHQVIIEVIIRLQSPDMEHTENYYKQKTKQLTPTEHKCKVLECESCIWVASSQGGDRCILKKQNCSMVTTDIWHLTFITLETVSVSLVSFLVETRKGGAVQNNARHKTEATYHTVV